MKNRYTFLYKTRHDDYIILNIYILIQEYSNFKINITKNKK